MAARLDILHQYVLGKELGHGSFGTVVRAVNKASGDSVRQPVRLLCHVQTATSRWPGFWRLSRPLLSPLMCAFRQVAIKIISKAGISNVGFAERVSREFFILTCLDHENVIRLLEVRARFQNRLHAVF